MITAKKEKPTPKPQQKDPKKEDQTAGSSKSDLENRRPPFVITK